MSADSGMPFCIANIYGSGDVVPELPEGTGVHQQTANGSSRFDSRPEVVGKGKVFPERLLLTHDRRCRKR